MTPDNRGGPRKGRPDTTDQPGESYTAGPSLFDIPAHRLRAAEANMKRVVNTMPRDRSHWWIRMIRAHQAECAWCRRCDWTPRRAA